MNTTFLFRASGAALAAILASPVSAQHQAMDNMPGMTMSKPAPAKPAARKSTPKPASKKVAPKALPRKGPATAPSAKSPARHATVPPTATDNSTPMTNDGMDHSTMDHSTMDHSTMEHSTMDHGAMNATPDGQPMVDHSTMDHGSMAPMTMDQSGMDHGEMDHHGMAMKAALGPYPMPRESSGTASQPDNSLHQGIEVMSGEWMLMAHGVLNLVADHQSGPRGDDMVFPSGMLMGMAQHSLGNGTIQFKAMLSPDPIMGKSGYPLLLASGETADGVNHLVDRQHPHDLFMELSGSLSQNIGPKSSVFVYAGLPGEPAFGPPAFMHRESIMDSPEAPITHHWLDSTHITFGVVTGGFILDRFKVEVSRFNAREPDQYRWNIETGPLDSTSVRLSWNPSASLSLQGSWAYFKHPEQLEPDVNQKRLSASLLYAREIAPGWHLAGTLAWGRKTADHHSDDAFAAEGSLKHNGWTIFSRAEMTANRELVDDHEAHEVGKFSIGAVRDFSIASHLKLGVGALGSVNFVPNSIAPLYGGNNPLGAMAFVRVKLD